MDSTQSNASMNTESSTWKYIFTDLADTRSSKWFLMSNPIPISLIMISYLYFVKVWGPKYMKDKEPYQLKWGLMIYNLLQVIANTWLFREAVLMWSTFNWSCQSIDYSHTPEAIWQAWACYLYFLNKIMDLMDTIFFVLRKKQNQITFLHMYHHCIMPWSIWFGVKYFPGGHGTFLGLVNTFVHILLYTYYYLAAFGPKVQKYLWWKKYLTRIQLTQFCLVILYCCQMVFSNCNFPKWSLLIIFPNTIFFYYLFNDFYKTTYTKTETKTHHVANDTTETVKTK